MPSLPRTELPTFHEVLQSLGRRAPLEETLDTIATHVTEVIRFSFCAIILPDPDGRRVHLKGAHALPDRYASRLNEIHLAPIGSGENAGSPTQRAMEGGRTVVLDDVLDDPSFAPWTGMAEEFGYRSLVSVPLVAQGAVIGVLNGYSRVPRHFTETELAAVETLAAQAAIAIHLATLVDEQEATIDTLRRVNDELEHQRQILERSHEIHLRLTDAVIEGADFRAVAETLSGLIDRPVAVIDAGGRTICTSDEGEAESLEALVATAMPLLRQDGSAASGKTHAVPIDGTVAVVGRIAIGAELLGYVVVAGGDEREGALDERAVEHAATVLALEIVKERVARATEERLRADFIFDLVHGRDDVGRRAGERARHYGMSLEEPHRVMVVELCDWAGHLRRLELSEEGGRSLKQRLLRLIDDVLAERAPGSLSSTVGDQITIAAPTGSHADEVEYLKKVRDDVARRAGRLAPALRIVAGIGSPTPAPGSFASSYQEAIQCLELLNRLGDSADALAVEELGVLRLLLDTKNPEELRAFARRTLGPALERDEKNDGALVSTLFAYIDRSCDVRTTATELYVHANTVKYRLAKVEEVCGLDLKDPNDLLKAKISQLVLKLTSPGVASRVA
ncbi:MAG: GAF domain-containing protein [Actinobacteria bacterium]|nr:GAF domain-containing protein [Actinomycetota bacterium]